MVTVIGNSSKANVLFFVGDCSLVKQRQGICWRRPLPCSSSQLLLLRRLICIYHLYWPHPCIASCTYLPELITRGLLQFTFMLPQTPSGSNVHTIALNPFMWITARNFVQALYSSICLTLWRNKSCQSYLFIFYCRYGPALFTIKASETTDLHNLCFSSKGLFVTINVSTWVVLVLTGARCPIIVVKAPPLVKAWKMRGNALGLPCLRPVGPAHPNLYFQDLLDSSHARIWYGSRFLQWTPNSSVYSEKLCSICWVLYSPWTISTPLPESCDL